MRKERKKDRETEGPMLVGFQCIREGQSAARPEEEPKTATGGLNKT